MPKQCSRCKEVKLTSQFNKNKTKKDGFQYYCKTCQAAGTKKHYEATKSVYIQNAAKRKIEMKDWFENLKSGLKCKNCPENHPACLQFHHRDPSQKDLAISSAMQSGWGKKRILEEIDKCDVLCANCHFKHHYNERH